MTPREQNLRNELGQLTHAHLRLNRNMQDMRADLVRQRDDMAAIINAIDAGRIADARDIAAKTIARHEATREPRKGRAA